MVKSYMPVIQDVITANILIKITHISSKITDLLKMRRKYK